MELIDSHTHLDMDAFAPDRDAVVARAFAAGLTHLVLIGAEAAVAIAERDARISAAVGVHPHEASLEIESAADPKAPVAPAIRAAWGVRRDQTLARLSALASSRKVVAIGEVGLDYHYDHSPRELQRELFRAQVRLAIRLQRPLVVHTREADADTVLILEQEQAQRVGGVIHCFSGSPIIAALGLRLGFCFGLAGPLTFPKAAELRQAVRTLPRDRLLIETDCPYLSPVPHRGQRNEPAFVIEVARTLAGLLDLSLEEAGLLTAQNTRRLFGIPGR